MKDKKEIIYKTFPLDKWMKERNTEAYCVYDESTGITGICVIGKPTIGKVVGEFQRLRDLPTDLFFYEPVDN